MSGFEKDMLTCIHSIEYSFHLIQWLISFFLSFVSAVSRESSSVGYIEYTDGIKSTSYDSRSAASYYGEQNLICNGRMKLFDSLIFSFIYIHIMVCVEMGNKCLEWDSSILFVPLYNCYNSLYRAAVEPLLLLFGKLSLM